MFFKIQIKILVNYQAVIVDLTEGVYLKVIILILQVIFFVDKHNYFNKYVDVFRFIRSIICCSVELHCMSAFKTEYFQIFSNFFCLNVWFQNYYFAIKHADANALKYFDYNL